MIKDLKEGHKINNESFLVTNVIKGATANAAPYLSLVLQDKSGIIDAKKWTILENDEETFKVGNVVSITGEVNSYRSNLQIKVQDGENLPLNQVFLNEYVPESPYSKDVLEERFETLINSLSNDSIKEVVNTIYKEHHEDLFIYPAAVRNHHEYVRGLMTHMLSMAEICDFLSKHYENIDRDILIAGALLHDIGKIVEFTSPLIPKYSIEGNLLGHITIGTNIVLETCKKLNINDEIRILLSHMILSHHGKHEYGSPVLPMTKEALLLSMVDDMDAKVVLVDKNLKDIEEGEFTSRIFALEDRCIYKPKK